MNINGTDIDTTPPRYAQQAAQIALQIWEDGYWPSRDASSTGIKRAQQLAAGKELSADDLTTIRAWFARHKGYIKEGKAQYDTVREAAKDGTYGPVAGYAWGSLRMQEWTNRKITQITRAKEQ